MDDTLQELENELKRLHPHRLSARLMAGLEEELGPAQTESAPPRYHTSTSMRSWKWAPWALAAAAAVAMVAIFQFASRRAEPIAPPLAEVAATTSSAVNAPVTAPANRFEPVQASSVLYAMKEDGTALLADQTEGRQVRYRYVDTYTWKNPASRASLRWSVPRDEVRIIRASLD